MARLKPHPESLSVGALLTVLVALGQISTALYIPSMPSLVEALATDAAHVNLTLTVFLCGFAVSQLVYGPLSDRFGRRPVLMAGMTLFLVASFACSFAPSIEALIAARFVQAVGACTGPVLGRAMVRDIYGRERAARALAYIGMAFAVSPAIVPIIGGYLQVWFGWRASFVFLSGIGGLIVLASWWMLEETNRRKDPNALDLGAMGRNFAMLLTSPVYMGYTLSVSFVFAALMSFVAVAPFVFIDTIGLSPDRFGMLAIFNAVGVLLGNGLAGRLTLRMGIERMVLLGILLVLAGGGVMTAIAASGHIGVAAIIGPMLLFFTGMGIVFPNAMAGAMAPFPKATGAASALLGFLQMAMAAGAGTLAGRLSHQTQLPLALLILGFGTAALVAFGMLVWRRRMN